MAYLAAAAPTPLLLNRHPRPPKKKVVEEFVKKVEIECPSDFGDSLTDFSCYLSIVLWFIVRRLLLGRGKSEQDYPSYFKTT